MTTATITPAEFEKAVARACLREANQHLSVEPFRCGDASAVLCGAKLASIADEAGLSIPQTRRRMRTLLAQGKVITNETSGSWTRWWLVGLAESQKQTAPVFHHPECVGRGATTKSAWVTAARSIRQGLTAPPAPAARQHWSDVLGVPRDCSTSEARAAFQSAVAALDQADPDYPNHSRRVRDAIDACCREHEIQIHE